MSESERRLLKEVADVSSGLSSPQRYQSEEEAEETVEYRVVKPGDLTSAGLVPVEELDAVRFRPVDIENYRLEEGDIVIISRGSDLRAVRIPKSDEPLLAWTNLNVIRPHDSLHGAVVFAFLASPLGQHELHRRASSSRTIRSLPVRELEAVQIPIPSDIQTVKRLVDLAEEQYQLGLEAVRLRKRVADEAVWRLLDDH